MVLKPSDVQHTTTHKCSQEKTGLYFLFQIPVILGTNSGEAILYISWILQDPLWLEVINEDWDTFWGPVFLLERRGNGDVTPEDSELARRAREFYFAPDGVINLEKLDRLVDVYTDALFA